MTEREDDTDLSAEESISDEISERVRSVLAAAESAAQAIRHEAEQQTQIKRRAAEAERARFLEDAKAEAEALLDERMKRISELSDSLIEGAEAILMRIEGAHEVKRQLETMVHALAHAAEELGAESEGSRATPPRPRPVAVEDPEPATVTELRAAPEPVEPTKPEPAPEPPAADDDDVEIVDAVAVVDDEPEVETAPVAEAEPEPEPKRPSAVERLRKAASPAAENGAKEESAPAEPRGFDGDDMLAARLVALQMAVAGSARDEVESHLRKTFALEEPGAILNDVFGAESKL
jgi:hypothetical protein